MIQHRLQENGFVFRQVSGPSEACLSDAFHIAYHPSFKLDWFHRLISTIESTPFSIIGTIPNQIKEFPGVHAWVIVGRPRYPLF